MSSTSEVGPSGGVGIEHRRPTPQRRNSSYGSLCPGFTASRKGSATNVEQLGKTSSQSKNGAPVFNYCKLVSL